MFSGRSGRGGMVFLLSVLTEEAVVDFVVEL
jgi:hypothetical protein